MTHHFLISLQTHHLGKQGTHNGGMRMINHQLRGDGMCDTRRYLLNGGVVKCGKWVERKMCYFEVKIWFIVTCMRN